MTILIDKQQIKDLQDLPFEVVTVPEWSCDVRVQALSGRGREAFNEAFSALREGREKGVLLNADFFALVVIHTVVNEAGEKVFGAEDIDWLAEKNEEVLSRVGGVGLRLNGFGPAAVEEAGKNSDAAPSGDSGSDSPSPSASQ